MGHVIVLVSVRYSRIVYATDEVVIQCGESRLMELYHIDTQKTFVNGTYHDWKVR